MPVLNANVTRIVIYPKDVEMLTGRRPRSARELLQKIKIALGKTKQQVVTLQEFCSYTGMEEGVVKSFIG